ncbi:hypothetical protein ACFSJU_14550 [Paradesertivirga mongoliensis]|uniref:Uncharacterized protein n=1 Tax=Paradesertivirga mongoliensis TaxID=2100740 RepID=A0ABW4ZQ75_9SPHI|nr:hypothetical protein [Pedobacter mongoliensis]
MKTTDNEQYSTPKNKSKRKNAPRQPGSDREEEIRQGATEADQLIKQKPEKEDIKTPRQLGKAPKDKISKGE